jgi:hypothetical protein
MGATARSATSSFIGGEQHCTEVKVHVLSFTFQKSLNFDLQQSTAARDSAELRRQAWPRRNPVTSKVDRNQQESNKRLAPLKDLKGDFVPPKTLGKPRNNASELIFETYDLHTGMLIGPKKFDFKNGKSKHIY